MEAIGLYFLTCWVSWDSFLSIFFREPPRIAK